MAGSLGIVTSPKRLILLSFYPMKWGIFDATCRFSGWQTLDFMSGSGSCSSLLTHDLFAIPFQI